MKCLITCLLCLCSTVALAAFPVLPVPAEQQADLLTSDSPKSAANKRLAYDLLRVVLAARLDLMENYIAKDVINHNPNEVSGFAGLKDNIQSYVGDKPREIKSTIDNLVAIIAEGDKVIMAFAVEKDNPNIPGEKVTETFFDMFRIVDGVVVEAWDSESIKRKK